MEGCPGWETNAATAAALLRARGRMGGPPESILGLGASGSCQMIQSHALQFTMCTV